MVNETLKKKIFRPLTKWSLAKQAMKIGMFFSVIFAGIQGYKIWSYFQKYPETAYEFKAGMMPQVLEIKIQMLQTGESLVYLTLFFYILFEICSMFELKYEHWLLGRLKKWGVIDNLKNFGDKIEDE